MRYPMCYFGGFVLLFAVGFFALRPTVRHLPPLATHAAERKLIVAPEPAEIPTRPESEPPSSPFSPQELTILRYLGKIGYGCGTFSPTERERVRQEIVQRELEFVAAGGRSAASLPFYLQLLNHPSRMSWYTESSILSVVAKIEGDRSAFRQPAVERLSDHKVSLACSALLLLSKIGTAVEAAKVAELFDYDEYEFQGQKRHIDFFLPVLDTLAAIGTEAEIAALDRAKARFVLWDRDDFWEKAEACKVAIRERLVKQKADAKPVEKK